MFLEKTKKFSISNDEVEITKISTEKEAGTSNDSNDKEKKNDSIKEGRN